MAIRVTQDMITAARRAEYDYYQKGRVGGSDRFIPTPDPVIRVMLEAAMKLVTEPEPRAGEPPRKQSAIVTAVRPKPKR
jgi:hypothetical protein